MIAVLERCMLYCVCVWSVVAANSPNGRSGYVVRSTQTRALTWHPLDTLDESQTPPDGAVVFGVFNDSIADLGTAKLKLSTTAGADDAELFAALGFAEGVLTANRIVQHMHNMFEQTPLAPEVVGFLLEHIAYLESQVEAHAAEDPYWGIVAALLARNRGLREGLKHRLEDSILAPSLIDEATEAVEAERASRRVAFLQALPDLLLDVELLRLNLVMDIDEIARAVQIRSRAGNVSSELDELVSAAHKRATHGHGHCSVLVKVVGSRLVFGHNTWKNYKEMLRIWKDISIPHVQNPAIVNRRLSFPSYPGYYASTDDWLMLPDSSLAVFETTDDAFDEVRLADHVRPSSIGTPLRSMIASLMASNPREWYEVFSRENSGTQNNQWMIIDAGAWHKVLSTEDTKPRDVFWVMEQQPGLIVGRDMTEHLLREGFWSSYNTPYFPRTAHASRDEQHPSISVACTNQRKWLLAEAQLRVHSVADMQELLTTNQWQSSAFAWSCPRCSVASRFDLPGKNASMGLGLTVLASAQKPLGCHPAGFFGSIDAKVADDMMAIKGETLFVSGPPHTGGVPAFAWSTATVLPGEEQLPSHLGHPRGQWTYPWIRTGIAKSAEEVGRGHEHIIMFL